MATGFRFDDGRDAPAHVFISSTMRGGGRYRQRARMGRLYQREITAGRTSARAADYRAGFAQFLCTGPTARPSFPRAPPRAQSYFASYGDNYLGPIRSADGADNRHRARELPDRAAADKFWNEEPFAKNGVIGTTRASPWVFGIDGGLHQGGLSEAKPQFNSTEATRGLGAAP